MLGVLMDKIGQGCAASFGKRYFKKNIGLMEPAFWEIPERRRCHDSKCLSATTWKLRTKQPSSTITFSETKGRESCRRGYLRNWINRAPKGCYDKCESMWPAATNQKRRTWLQVFLSRWNDQTPWFSQRLPSLCSDQPSRPSRAKLLIGN